jgi:hypothetical protein
MRLLVSDSLSSFTEKFPWAIDVIGEPDFHFSNGGDAIRLYDNTGKIQFSVRYNDKAPWPSDADGLGFTLECTNGSDNPNFASNWVAGCLFGTPGFFFSLPCGDAIEESGSAIFTISPNPFSDHVEISIDGTEQIVSAFVTDIAGRLIATPVINGNTITWDGSANGVEVETGIYYFRILDGKGNVHGIKTVKFD